MHNRILDLSEEPAYLAVRNACLIIRRDDKPEISMPLDDVAVVVASHPQVTCTQAVLAGLSAAGAAFITCDTARLPVGMMLPLQGNFVQAERIARQIAAKLPVRKRLWQSIVQNKIRAQAATLELEVSDDAGLRAMADRVRSGDPENLEAQAARRYWTRIFGEESFRRDREAEGTNAVLNYGYAVLRAITARAVCASGLHPSIGVHHHNRYSQFTLADDLMEPFRVVVDRAAIAIRKTWGPEPSLDKHVKAALVEALTARYRLGDERRSLFDITSRVSSSLVEVFEGSATQLVLPKFPEFFADAADAA